eukprot:13435078-Alexandrium_andersonii.AAC.1
MWSAANAPVPRIEAIGAVGGRGGKTVPCASKGRSTRSDGKGPNKSEPIDGAGPSGSSIRRQPMCSPSSMALPQKYVLPAGSGLPQGAEPSELPRTARLCVLAKQDSRHRRL